MRRMKNFMFSGLLLAAVSVSAEVPPSIHVDGKNLTDTHGNKVVLHGVMDTPSPYFNNYRWGNAANDATKKTASSISTSSSRLLRIPRREPIAMCSGFIWILVGRMILTFPLREKKPARPISRNSVRNGFARICPRSIGNHRKGIGPWALCSRASSRRMPRWHQSRRVLSGLPAEGVGHRFEQYQHQET